MEFYTSITGRKHGSQVLQYSPESESEVAQSCPTLCDPMGCSLPGYSVHGIFQARVLEWVAIALTANLNPFSLAHGLPS